MMRWTDTQQIAEALYDEHPDVNPLKLRFTELHAMVLALDGFADVAEKSIGASLEWVLEDGLDEL